MWAVITIKKSNETSKIKSLFICANLTPKLEANLLQFVPCDSHIHNLHSPRTSREGGGVLVKFQPANEVCEWPLDKYIVL